MPEPKYPPKDDCLNCVLPICDQDRGKPCRFLVITRDEHVQERKDTLRRQKREHNARVRASRRAEIPDLLAAFRRLTNEYGAFGKHSEVMRMVRAAAQRTTDNGQRTMPELKTGKEIG